MCTNDICVHINNFTGEISKGIKKKGTGGKNESCFKENCKAQICYNDHRDSANMLGAI